MIPFGNWKVLGVFGGTLAFLLHLLFAANANAQTTTTGGVSGTVTDPSNAVVVGAAVALKSVERAFTLQTKTDTSGGFRFELLHCNT